MFNLTTGEKKRFFQDLDDLSRDTDASQVDEGYEESVTKLKAGDFERRKRSPSFQELRAPSAQAPPGRQFPSFNGPSSFVRPLTRTTSLTSDRFSTSRNPVRRLLKPSLERSTSAPSGPSQLHAQDQRVFQLREAAATRPLSKSEQSQQPPTRERGNESAMSKQSGLKRKRGPPVTLVPEEKRIFKDLIFYFCPNDDVNKKRRARIEKACQHGATWTRTWTNEVTHIVADKDVDFKYLSRQLGLDLTKLKVDIVNEEWIPNCIQWTHLLNPRDGKRFRVSGHQDALEQAAPAAEPFLELETSQTSLQLKPASKGRLLREPETPSRAGGSSQDTTLIEATPAIAHGTAQRAQKAAHENDDVAPEYHDELSEAITSAKAFAHLPLDADDHDSCSDLSSSRGSDSEGDDQQCNTSKLELTKKLGTPAWQNTFQCMQKHTADSKAELANAKTIELLQEMVDYYQRTQDDWRVISYRKAIASLRKCTWKVTSKKDAMSLPNIGRSIAEKIEEVVWTDRLRKLEHAKSDSADSPMQLFLGVYGAGPKQAARWVAAGFKTLDDLLKTNISKNQRIGIDHYADFNSRISREEVRQHGVIVRKQLQEIDNAFTVTIMGSYRRGAKDSGDIDLIITKPGASLETIQYVVFETLIPRLFKAGFLVARLASSSKHNDGTKFHGASVLPTLETAPHAHRPWRRIDILTVPEEEIGAALIYFTGNDIFNRSIRLLASKKGMRLNQRGLYRDVLRSRGRDKVTDGTLVEGRSEKRIFEILGVPWRPPEHRIC